MVIAIELNNIVRDYNTQLLKYYRKAYDANFGDEDMDLNCTDLLPSLPFNNNKERKLFKEIDYPYELFGCARTTSRHLHVEVADWLSENEDIEIIYFSLGESGLMIQSTYFFLSKGSKVRTMIFPKEAKDIWNFCDVAVTLNKDVINNKPNNKKVILIEKSDNKHLKTKVDLVYSSLHKLINDKDFRVKLDCSKTFKNNPIKKYLRWLKIW